ncbi:Rho-type gtpase-activating protein [Umbelopsis sp. WA50703]
MTGDEAYHADCFRCVQCGDKIEDLVFTQTSKGIFCTACHEIRKQLKLKRKEDKSRNTNSTEYAANKQLPVIPGGPPSNRPAPVNHILDSQLISDYLQSPNPDKRDYLPRRGESMDIPNRNDVKTLREGNRNRSESVDQLQQRPKLNLLDKHQDTLSGRQASASSILNSYSDISTPKGVTTPETKTLDQERLSELNHLLDASATAEAAPKTSSPPSVYQSLDEDSLEPDSVHDDPYVQKLKKQLRTTVARLKEVEGNFAKIKSVSRNALNEFNLAKEEFANEVSARQSAEESSRKANAQLKALQDADINGQADYVRVTREEISHLGLTRSELDITCKQLREIRDTLAREISELADKYRAGLTSYISPSIHLEYHQQALQQEIKSLQLEREMVKNDIEKQSKVRDEVINETVTLNIKMAELTEMNNDLSRRVTEREREAAAVMAGTAFLNSSQMQNRQQQQESPQSSRMSNEYGQNTPVKKIAQRDSFIGTQAPRKFNFRKNRGANMFGKLGNNTNNYQAGKVRSPPQMMNGETGYAIGADNSLAAGPPVPTPSLSETSSNRRKPMGSPPSNSDVSIQQFSQYQGQHELIQASFLRLVKCDICSDKIWGRNELKCQACGCILHQKCLSNLPSKCNRKSSLENSMGDGTNSDHSSPVIGNDLASQVRIDGGTVPHLVKQCIEAVEHRGIDFEGIYRKSGGASQMRFIQQAFENGDSIDLKDVDQFNDICAITSVLKTYFRELPNPLLTYELHPKFIDAISNKARDEQIQCFYQLIHQLPTENYNTLKYLMQHLDKVRQNSGDNLMTAKNISVVFGPTLMRDVDPNRDLLEMNFKNASIEFILNHLYVLFTRSSIDEEPQKNSGGSPGSNNSTLGGHRRTASSDERRRAIPPAMPPRAGGDYI